MWRRLKRLYTFLTTVVVVGVASCFLFAGNLCKLKDIDGKRTFYLYSASSQATQVQTLRFEDLFSVKGESVRFALVEDGRTTAEDILSRYDATVCLEERVDGVTSYYAVSPRLGVGVRVGEYTVNLHVAVSTEECVVGSPIIFGGF